VLRGRGRECETLDRLLYAVRAGESRALVVRGEAGVGKTALLDYLLEQARGCRVARASGVQSEMELPFAGLQQLCAPMLDRLGRLPGPQRNALRIAFGLVAGDAPDRFFVGLAVLSLLSDVAEGGPLVCVVDDAQWLDRASAQSLAFVARRLFAESVAMVIAAREFRPERELVGLPELLVEGLSDGDARALLDSVIHGPLDERVRDRIVAETRGNPLALLELPRGLTPAELAGGFGRPDALPLSGRIEESFRRRLEALPADTRRLLLVAATEPVGDPALVWRAAERFGIGVEAAAPAAAAGLLDLGARVLFRHPLVRSAAYRSASLRERQSVHGALAEVSDRALDPDRRAWHRAYATSGLNEEVAAELERSAGRGQARGGLAAAAAFLERAAQLTPDPARRARRMLAAARAKHQAGAPDVALELLTAARAGPLDALERAQAQVLRAGIAFTTNRGSDAAPLLLSAAKQLEALDVTLARETYLDALMAAQFAGRLAPGVVLQVAEAARAAPASPAPRAPDLLLDGFAVMITEGHRPAAPLLKRALNAFLKGDITENGGFRWLWLAMEAAQEVWDYDAWHDLAIRLVETVREAGALSVLPLASNAIIIARIYAGELSAAESGIDEAEIANETTGSRLAPYGALILLAWRGREAELMALIETTLEEIVPRGEGIGVSTCQWLVALVRNSLGQYERALEAARQVVDPPRKLDWTLNATLPELVEAAARSGHAQEARKALEQLADLARPSGADWGLGLEARCRALLSEPVAAEPLYQAAIERLGRTRVRAEHARAHLLYGEWLRRQGRRMDAREQLRSAHGMFTAMGMEAFAERAARELLATGETARKHTVETRDYLTPQESQIARLARDGLSNPEIGARLFISPRTVEYHLHKVFAKLDISSRNQLVAVLASETEVAQPA
jgi:DNA-binding CsgD family transcriptional regulator/tetratricopeptide (TPR) repeat protein